MKRNPPSLAARRRELATREDVAFHCSLPLYILAEPRPSPREPGRVEVTCWGDEKKKGVLAFFSPVDALLSRIGGINTRIRYQLLPLEAMNPSELIQEQQGWFGVCLVYGFAAIDRRVMQAASGELIPLVWPTYFGLTSGVPEHFHLQFKPVTTDWLDGLHDKAGFNDYPGSMERLTEESLNEQSRRAADACSCADFCPASENELTHIALYDHAAGYWRFVSFDDYPLPRGSS